MQPLSGIRVIDLSTVVFGPLASQVLADYGAEVIKVEAPGGDSTRHTGPAAEPGMSAVFLGSNRNKKSVLLDLKQALAREQLQALIAGADVFMHSMRPQKLAPLGIAPEQLAARFPKLVYAGLHGFAEAGPHAGRPAYDDVIQGMSGLAGLFERQGGQARYLPTIAADKTCAQVAAHAILAALVQRGRTGAGCTVEIPMYETMVAFNLVEHLYGAHFEPPRGDMGYPRVLAPWRRPWRTTDGHVCLMPYTDAHWSRFFAHVGAPEMAADPRFAGMAQRTRHIGALLEAAGGFVARWPTAYWLAVCDSLEIPAAPVQTLEELLADPQLAASGFFEWIDDPAMGRLRFTGVPVRFDGRPPPPVRMPPRLGEHTAECLAAAGWTGAGAAMPGGAPDGKATTAIKTGDATDDHRPPPSSPPPSPPP